MFCVRGFGGWLGFLLCGVVLVVRLVFWFSGSGLSVCLVPVVLLRGCAGVRGAGCGWFRVRGSVGASGSSSCDGWGVGRAGPGCRECFAGVGLRPVLLRLVGWWGVGRVFFRSALLVFSWFPVLVFVVLPGVGGLWGVSGWVRGFFSGFCCTGPGLFGFGLGFVWRV